MVLCSFIAFSHSLPLISSVTMLCTVPSSRQWGAIPEGREYMQTCFLQLKSRRCLHVYMFFEEKTLKAHACSLQQCQQPMESSSKLCLVVSFGYRSLPGLLFLPTITIGIRARSIKALYTTGLAERVLGTMCVEGVCCQIISTLSRNKKQYRFSTQIY